jgi:V8-like Glu-specific endopeptidase
MQTTAPSKLRSAAPGTDVSRRRPAGETTTGGEGVGNLPRAADGERRPATTKAGASFVGLELPWHSATRYGYAPSIPAVGRLWFTSGGSRLACTATAITNNIVVTAAHCVYDTSTRQWSKKLAFVPGVNGTRRPYGKFPGRTTIVPSRWTDPAWQRGPGTGGHAYFAQDFAFVVLRPNRAGRHVGSYVQPFGLLANAPSGSIYHLGYPYEGPFSSCTAKNCRPWHVSSPIQRYSQYAGGKYDVGISAYTSGGMSGGPWFQEYNGQWYVASVLSHGGKAYSANGGRYFTTDYGAYFDDDTLSIFRYAQSQ